MLLPNANIASINAMTTITTSAIIRVNIVLSMLVPCNLESITRSRYISHITTIRPIKSPSIGTGASHVSKSPGIAANIRAEYVSCKLFLNPPTALPIIFIMNADTSANIGASINDAIPVIRINIVIELPVTGIFKIEEMLVTALVDAPESNCRDKLIIKNIIPINQ